VECVTLCIRGFCEEIVRDEIGIGYVLEGIVLGDILYGNVTMMKR